MEPLDLIIRGGRVVTPNGVVAADIGIRAGRIAVVAPASGQGPAPSHASPGGLAATRTLDASGLLVLPGLVDVHVHLREPGFSHKEDFSSGTSAAAAGGVTTVIAQPNTNPAITDVSTFNVVRALGERSAVVDFGITAAATPTNLGEFAGLMAAGAASLDLALGGSAAALTTRSNADLLAIFAAIQAVNAIATIYVADSEVATAATQAVQAQGRKDVLAFADAFPAAVEVMGAARTLAAALTTGVRVHLRQLSCAETLRLLPAWRDLAGPGRLTAEVTPHNLYLDRSALERLGHLAVMGPPLRGEADNRALQQALRDGTVDIVATDHAPHARAEKEAAGDDVWRCPPGVPGLETLLPSLLAAVTRGELTLDQVARVAAEQPARIFGLYPRKGVIAVGADADLVLVDDTAPCPVQPERFLSKACYSPFTGQALRGRVLATLVRGQTVYAVAGEAGGALTGAAGGIRVAPGYGRFVAPGQ